MTEHTTNTHYFDLIMVVVNMGRASRVLEEAKKKGITGGTITYGHGTVSSGLLRKLGLLEVRKEILYMVSERKNTIPTIDHINEVFHLDQPNRGIIFSTPLANLVGTHGERYDMHETDPIQEATHELFVSVVPAGMSDQVIDAVREAGGSGGTILHGLGAFDETATRVFGIEINAEKEIILNLVRKDIAVQVERTLVERIDYQDYKNGVLFSMDVHQVRGIYRGKA